MTIPLPGQVGDQDTQRSLDALSQQLTNSQTTTFGTGYGYTSYIHTQGAEALTWTIPHNIGAFASVMVVDTNDQVIYADITYIDEDEITIAFGVPTAGKAYLNTGSGTTSYYTHDQSTASAVWNVAHNLDRRCSVTAVDSSNSVVIGEITYVDDDNVIITFASALAGKAYCN